MDYKNFFLKNNKSGYKTKESWLIKNNYELYDKIISNINLDISFIEKIYLFINNMSEIPKCPHCNKPVKFNETLRKGYNKYCSVICLNQSKEHKEKIKQTNLEKYGYESHNQVDLIKQLKKETYLKKYDVDNPMKSEKLREKQKKVLIEKYCVDNPMKINTVLSIFKNNVYNGTEKNVNRVINKLKNKYAFIKHENNEFYFKCLKCNNVFNINANLLNSRYINNRPICLFCNPKRSFNFLSNLLTNDLINIDFELNNRSKIKKEIDIYFPNHKIGIEINGLYWHSHKFKDKDYHLNKTELCESKGIHLIHLFEDEILNKTDIVKSIIKSKLNIFENIINDYDIKEINNNQLIKEFLENNHIQGYVKSDIKIGLFNDNELVSLMIFKKISENKYEILRFCDKLDTLVTNSINNLIEYFKNYYNPKSIITFLDRRYDNGDNYKQLGFNFDSNTKPNCFYFNISEMIRYNNFENEIVNEKQYHYIYDCGNIKFIKTF